MHFESATSTPLIFIRWLCAIFFKKRQGP